MWRSRLSGHGLNEATKRHILGNINQLQRVIVADEAATQQLDDLAKRCDEDGSGAKRRMKLIWGLV